ncbi:XRE family transcriptional regulator [Paenibacillus lautus]|uniref:XRE family transcriptional regulator n=1 Tax=Paenibacillus lautus TaxID=1401 RepID=UPI003D2A2EE8
MSEKYIAGTKRGTGITYNRNDDELIQIQKEKIGSIIKNTAKQNKLTYRKIEEITNVYNPQISAMANGKTNYSIDNFLRVLNALGLELVIKEGSEEYEPDKIDLIINMLEQLKSR